MERIKQFLIDDSATAEATSTVVMIAAVGLLLAGALYVWYTHLSNFFDTAGKGAADAAGQMNWVGPSS